VLPTVERHLSAYLSWGTYAATPDYEARPEPGHGPRIQLVTPGR
jgi:lipoyl(octanoyl) transferase